MSTKLSKPSSLFFSPPRLIDTIYLPKFSISSDYNLQHFLSELGIQKVFTSEADLSGITDVMDLEVSQVSF